MSVQTRPMCNQYVMKFMRSTRSAHARALECNNIIFFGPHEKRGIKEVYGTLKDDLWSNNCLHSVHIADEMNQIIECSPMLIETYAAIMWDLPTRHEKLSPSQKSWQFLQPHGQILFQIAICGWL